MELDLAFVVDETGSMGQWIQSVKSNIIKIIRDIKRTGSITSLHIGIIGFRDHPPQDRSFITRQIPLTSDVSAIQNFVSKMEASGGGDVPEALVPAMYDLTRLEWRYEAEKVAVIVTDAPPHGCGAVGDAFPMGDPSGESFVEQSRSAREIGITLHCMTCGSSGITKEVCRKIASIGRGVCISSSQADVLPGVIVGSAIESVEWRNVVSGQIVRFLENPQVKRRVLEAVEEEDRVEIVVEECTKNRLKRKRVSTSGGKTVYAIVGWEDVETALMNEIRKKPHVWFAAMFSRLATGISSRVMAPGLYDRATENCVPLTKIAVDITIRGGIAARVSVKQTFVNSFPQSIEATYKFPLASEASVNRFVAEIDGKALIGKCMEKEKAQETYDDAIASGSGAYLLQEVTPELFEVSVGRLPPGKEVLITVEYVAKLLPTNSVSTYKFVLPTKLAPRGKNVEVKMRLLVEAGIAFECSSHELLPKEEAGDDRVFALSDVEDGLSRDVVLLFNLQESSEGPKVVTEPTDGFGKVACAIDFVPNVGIASKLAGRTFESPVILVLDYSSSMRMFEQFLCDAYDEFCSRVAGCFCRFNVYKFSSGFSRCFPSLMFSSEANPVPEIPHALDGGSEIHQALGEIFDDGDGPKNLLLITDGHLTGSSRILRKLKQSDGQIRVFPIGVGACVNSHLLGKLAQSTNGHFTSCSTGESIRDAVSAQLRRMWLSWTDVRLNSDISSLVPLVTPGARSALFLLLDDLESSVALSGTNVDGESVKMEFDLRSGSSKNSNLIHTIAARDLIDLKQSDDANKSIVVDLATHYSIASKFTSFVAVEDREEAVEEDSLGTISLDADGQMISDLGDAVRASSSRGSRGKKRRRMRRMKKRGKKGRARRKKRSWDADLSGLSEDLGAEFFGSLDRSESFSRVSPAEATHSRFGDVCRYRNLFEDVGNLKADNVALRQLKKQSKSFFKTATRGRRLIKSLHAKEKSPLGWMLKLGAFGLLVVLAYLLIRWLL